MSIFTPDKVESLNAYQSSGVMHPFTCGNNDHHSKDLVATVDGWICPECSYTQNWAHDWMKNWRWKNSKVSYGSY